MINTSKCPEDPYNDMIDVPVTAAMTQAAPIVPPDTSAVDAADHLRDPEVPALLVGNDPESVWGIITESDMVAAVAEQCIDHPVESFMSTPLLTTNPTTPVGLAADRMRQQGITTLPVVEDGTYVGLTTRETLGPYLSRRRLEIDWTGEPLSVTSASPENTPAPE